MENRRKIEPQEMPSRLIPHLLVVFTRQLEILVTTLVFVNFVCFDGANHTLLLSVSLLTNYLAVHKLKFALVQDEALCGQKSQYSG